MNTKRETSSIMADRLKRLRESRNLSHDRLSQAIAEKYEEYGVSISRDSLINYEKANDKNLGMRAECLRCLADFYGVSTDYLLGIADEKSPDTDARAVIAYTGLSEDNVLTLHHMKENASNPMLSDAADDGAININGCKPYLDCLNDLLDAIYSKKDTIIRDYIPMQYYAEWNKRYDPLYFSEERELDLQAHGHTSVPISAFIEQKSIKIAREIEKYLIGKYTCMDGDDE